MLSHETDNCYGFSCGGLAHGFPCYGQFQSQSQASQTTDTLVYVQALSSLVDSNTEQLIHPVLEELANDADMDVKYFAQRALTAEPVEAAA